MSQAYISRHRELVSEKTALHKQIMRDSATLASVDHRLARLDKDETGAEFIKASDKRRHTDARLTEAHERLIEIEGLLEQLRFEAEFV